MNRVRIKTAALTSLALFFLLSAGVCAETANNQAANKAIEAKKIFGAINAPASLPARAIGGYSRGCIAGAEALPISGPGWQAMRLSRNRNWGHPILIKFIEKLAVDAQRLDGWPGLLVGDMGQPLGGPMLTGHASHQIGLDADIWLKPMPSHLLSPAEREDLSADNMVDEAALTVNKSFWSEAQFKLLKRAASYTEVARIFVHPVIKKALCDAAGTDRAWLEKIRPWWGHNYHFHVRLNCPAGSPGCIAQIASPSGDGCGQELDYWFKLLKAPKPSIPPQPPKILLMSDMPKECQELAKAAERAQPGKAAAK